MSYIRYGHPLTYVEGDSLDYVFGGETSQGVKYIEDYGDISDSGFIELLFKNWTIRTGRGKEWDELFKRHLLARLAKRLGVKLREKRLTKTEIIAQVLISVIGR